VRLGRVALRRRVRAGSVRAVDVIRETPEEALTMSVFSLLTAQARWGRARALRVLRLALMSESRTLGELTERQRDALVRLLDPPSPDVRAPLAEPIPDLLEVAWGNADHRPGFRHLSLSHHPRALCGALIDFSRRARPGVVGELPLCRRCARSRASRGW
jgi:hypothetical protein